MARRSSSGRGAPLGWVGLTLLGLGLASGARAQEDEPPITLDVSGCPELDAALVDRLLRIELSMDLEQRGARPEDATRVVATCASDDVADVAVEDPTTGKSSARRVRLAPRGSERLLALAMAELIAASWAEHHLAAHEEVERIDQTASPETVAAASDTVAPRVASSTPEEEEPPPPEPPRWSFGALFASVGVSGRPAHATFGLGLQVGLELNPLFAALVDATYDVGRVRAQPGDVELRRVTGGVKLVVRTRLGPWVPFGGVGARLGFAFLRADASVPGAGARSGRVGGPLVLGGVSYGSGVLMALAWVELGWHTWAQRGFLGEGPDAPLVAAKDRAWGALQVAIAVRL